MKKICVVNSCSSNHHLLVAIHSRSHGVQESIPLVKGQTDRSAVLGHFRVSSHPRVQSTPNKIQLSGDHRSSWWRPHVTLAELPVNWSIDGRMNCGWCPLSGRLCGAAWLHPALCSRIWKQSGVWNNVYIRLSCGRFRWVFVVVLKHQPRCSPDVHCSLDGEVSVSTTRPETMLGDVAVAVHPDDPRYQASS